MMLPGPTSYYLISTSRGLRNAVLIQLARFVQAADLNPFCKLLDG